jgi:hypothetical protein
MSRPLSVVSLLLAMPAVAIGQQAMSFAATADTGPVAEAIFETKDAAALTAGLSPLSKTQLRKNEREVRIWYSSFANPQYLVIIRQTGNVTTGKLMLWWDQYYETEPFGPDLRVDNFVRKSYDCSDLAKRDSHYGEDKWVSTTCEATLKSTPDWNAFLTEVESHALPQNAPAVEQDDNGSENWGITVERKSGANYGVSHYHVALSLGAAEPGRGLKLQEMVNALAASAKRETAVAQH